MVFPDLKSLQSLLTLTNMRSAKKRDEETGMLLGCEIDEEPMLPILPTLGISVTF